ncbi:hypothetical protein SMSP2_00064 [Limihaloglobus sulfuriphilus]|uniref:Uncharacterized protein n=1 Tax=Limihaloglobus sulfuriphilus TaxID=1851148 RepID=A0A1Q2MAI1_9BACT|nr:hypothetical protein [Limihaloglobus sulfuriphilus]AQQ69733.1 hypothetical protein SMSP2_00064 [Limihaloglobus sulfuriphilus]
MKSLKILLLIAVSVLSVALAEQESRPARPGLIRDGVKAEGIDGRVVFDEKNEHFVFIPDERFSDGSRFIRAGSEIELLQNNTLEAVLKGQEQEKGELGVRLWGTFTKYKDKNYIYLSRYLPLKKIVREKDAQTGDDAGSSDDEAQTSDDKEKPDNSDESLIPTDILSQMEPEKVVDVKKMKEMLSAGNDAAVTDRTVIVEKQGEKYLLKFDSYGQNVSDESFTLLSSEAMELLTGSMRDAPYRRRFEVAGIATVFQGETYFLLQRFRRAYPYGNFPR